MGPRSLVVAIVVLLGLLEARSAEACSCVGRRLSRVVMPDPSTVAVAPAKDGFWATAVSGYHAMVFGELACASQPSRFAPDRIAIP